MSPPEKHNPPRLAIVAAFERELRPLIKTWTPHCQIYDGRAFRFFEHSQTVAIAGGIGPVAARRATQAVIALYSPQLIYSAGFAGAATEALKIADILIPRKVINASDGSSIDTGQGEGTLVTFAQVASREQKSRLAASFSAQAIDMEAAAVAHAAAARGIRFAAIKAVSDTIDFEFPAMEPFIDPAGQFRTARFARFLVLRPWLWATALHLARNSAQAAHALCNSLRHIIESHTPQPTSLEASVQR